ncbi:MAG: hypothetical protein RIB58_06040 [Phycisphaerales bacterium]
MQSGGPLEVLIARPEVVDRGHQWAVAQPARYVFVRELGHPIRGAARPEILEQAGPRRQAGASDDLGHGRPKVRRTRQAGQYVHVLGIGKLVEVFQQLGQAGHDRHHPDGVPFVVAVLRALDHQPPLQQVHVAPGERRQLRGASEPGVAAEPHDGPPTGIRAGVDNPLGVLDADVVRPLGVALGSRLQLGERVGVDDPPRHGPAEDELGHERALGLGGSSVPGIGLGPAPACSALDGHAGYGLVLAEVVQQAVERLLVRGHRRGRHVGGFLEAVDELGERRGVSALAGLDQPHPGQSLVQVVADVHEPRGRRLARQDAGPRRAGQVLDVIEHRPRGVVVHLAQVELAPLAGGIVQQDAPGAGSLAGRECGHRRLPFD